MTTSKTTFVCFAVAAALGTGVVMWLASGKTGVGYPKTSASLQLVRSLQTQAGGVASACGKILAIQASGIYEGESATVLLRTQGSGHEDPIMFRSVPGYRPVAWHSKLPLLILAENDLPCVQPGFAILDLRPGQARRFEEVKVNSVYWTFLQWEHESGTLVFANKDTREFLHIAAAASPR